MKHKVQLCSLDNPEFLNGVIEELEVTVASQMTEIKKLNDTIDQLRIERGIWRKAVEDTVTTLLNVELPESYNGLQSKEEQ